MILKSNFISLENSDNSNSSTYHSSAKNPLFSEPNVRKYLCTNEQDLIKRKLMNNNNHKNKNKRNIAFDQNTFNLDRRKMIFNITDNNINNNNKIIKDNRNFMSTLNLNEKNLNKNNSIQNNFSRNKNSSPIKILSNNEINNSSSSFFSDNSKLPNKTLIIENKSLNSDIIIHQKFLRPISSKVKLNNDELKKMNMKRFSALNNKELNFFKILNRNIINSTLENKQSNNFTNFILRTKSKKQLLKKTKKRPKSVSLKRKIISLNEINEISQLKNIKQNNNNKDNNNKNNNENNKENNNKNNNENNNNNNNNNNNVNNDKLEKRNEEKKITINSEKIINKKNSFISLNSDCLLKKKISNNVSLFKRSNLIGKVQRFITYHTSSETDSENSSEEEKKNKSNSFHIKPKISYFSVSLKKLNKSQNLSVIKHKKKNFEKDISNRLNFLEYQKINFKSKIIIQLNSKLIDIINKCETNINKLEENCFKKEKKNILEYIKEIKKDYKFLHNKERFERRLLKKNKKIKNKYSPLNKYYITNCIINIYHPVNIYEEIYYNKYLRNNKYNKNVNLLKNFEYIPNEKIFVRKAKLTNNFSDSTNSDDCYFISYNNLPKKDYNFLFDFYFNDYEYNIKFTEKKFTFDNNELIEKVKSLFEKNNKFKKKETKSIINNIKKEGSIYKKKESKDAEKKEKEKEKKEIKLLYNSLSKSNFYKRRISEKKKRNKINVKNISRLSKKITKTLKEIELEKQEKKDNYGYYNKIQMLSQVNDLKYQIIQNLKQTEIIFFYIKDRNYPAFKSLFEKYKLDSELKDIKGNSLLNLAVQSNSFLIVNYLLNIGADVNSINNNYNSPLHYALSFHNFEIADMLINRGADETLKNKSGMTPWQCLDSGLSII